MTALLPLALSLPSVDNLGRFIVSVLAVAGAAFVGGLFVGALMQVLAKVLTARKVPRPALIFVRLLGGLVAAILVAMVLFQSGSGGGWGWGGGGSGAGNQGEANGKNQAGKDRPAPPDKPPPKDAEPPPKAAALKVEVLLDSGGRFYRLEGEPKPLTLKEMAETLPARRQQNPELQKVVIVIYPGSPDRDAAVVRDLVRLVQDNNLTPDISLAKRQMP